MEYGMCLTRTVSRNAFAHVLAKEIFSSSAYTN
jgi:hypothetical protein